MLEPALQIKALVAGNGDSVLISYQLDNNRKINILVDGGNGKTNYKNHLKPVIESIVDAGQKLDLIIITHIDQDHIKGIIYLTRDINKNNTSIKQESICRYWFNSALSEKVYASASEQFDISANEMKELERFLHQQPDERWDIKDYIGFPLIKTILGATFTILSPDKIVLNQFTQAYTNTDISTLLDDYEHSLESLYTTERVRVNQEMEELDDKLENASSIGFLFEYQNVSLLYLGDSIPAIIDKSLESLLQKRNLKRLKVNVVKLSHHGSRKSLSFKFLELVECYKFLICANGKKAKLPNKATFAKIIMHSARDRSQPIEFYFNHPDFSRILNFTNKEKEKYNFSCHDANFDHGYLLKLPLIP
jgi:beta-lactamase superfamily II metal-dependent hydrolase